ncbi:MAG: hypothetical protein EP312_10580 [Gammaproteobacteria bacterium]|nr:MAG: hypothetical protein EP312_10580 [Gammaproteobacteria bacterium]
MAKPHVFTVAIKGDVHQTLETVRALICENGGRFDGDHEAGKLVGVTPVGSIKGHYIIKGKNCQVTITDKPMLAPMKRIEEAVRDYFDTV